MANKGFSLYKWCRNCKHSCCETVHDLILTEGEIKRIEKFANVPRKGFVKSKIRKLKKNIRFNIMKTPRGRCVFYKDKMCSIQKVKPYGCVGWPVCFSFDFEDMKNIKIEWWEDENCPAKPTKAWTRKAIDFWRKNVIYKNSAELLAAHQTIRSPKLEMKILAEEQIPKQLLPKMSRVRKLIKD